MEPGPCVLGQALGTEALRGWRSRVGEKVCAWWLQPQESISVAKRVEGSLGLAVEECTIIAMGIVIRDITRFPHFTFQKFVSDYSLP